MAIIANLYIDQGTDFSITVDCTDVSGEVLNLTGYTAVAQIRKTYSSSTVSATFSTSINASAGQVTLSLTDTQTSGLESGRYVYDLNITKTSTSETTRVVEGQAILTPEGDEVIMANIKARVLQGNQIRAKQVAIGNSTTVQADLSQKSINELLDVNASETDKGLLNYNQATDKWETTNTIDGGTF